MINTGKYGAEDGYSNMKMSVETNTFRHQKLDWVGVLNHQV